ncbi:MAG TPA: PDZ domain-containing protein [Armatimonadota bacterium]|jgi:predicted metalloprotease with PDZ domain
MGKATCFRACPFAPPVVLALALLAVLAPARAARVDYTFYVNARAKSIHVSAAVADDPDPTVTVAIPTWVPGYYRRLDQATGVLRFGAAIGGARVSAEHPTASTWTISHAPNQAVTVDYDVAVREYGFGGGDPSGTLGQMGVYVDGNSAFVHPGIACVYVEGHTADPATLTLKLPDGWDAATPLAKGRAGAYEAPSYDALADSPVQMGRFGRIAFRARNKPFEIITTGSCPVSDAALIDVCKRAATSALDLFGGWSPFDSYQFHLHFPRQRRDGGGGLEHRSSSVIVFARGLTDETFAPNAARIIFHEFFHAWNVKALHPRGLGPFNYQGEPRTPSLWIAEGLTDYYAHVLAVRGGVWTPEIALKAFAGLIDEYRGSAGRNAASLATSSEKVWDADSPMSNGYGGTNYYTKGLLAAWLLDIRIRASTKNARSLDDALRRMLVRYALPDRPYPPDAVLAAIRESTGVNPADDYAAFVYGTKDLPLEEGVRPMGVRLRIVDVPETMLGADLESGDSSAVVHGVSKGGAAEAAGMLAGDVLLSIDGQPPRIGKGPLLGGRPRGVGDRVLVIVRRAGEERTLSVTVQARPTAELTRVESPTPEQSAVWKGLWGQ